MLISVNNIIELAELKKLFSLAFSAPVKGDEHSFSDGDNQSLEEWFGINHLKEYLNFCRIITATEEDTLVGAAIIGMQNPLTWPDGNKYELFILAVHPDFRHKGIGSDLLRTAESEASAAGARALLVSVHTDLLNVQNFYKNMNYTLIGKLARYFDNGDAVFFMKKLGEF